MKIILSSHDLVRPSKNRTPKVTDFTAEAQAVIAKAKCPVWYAMWDGRPAGAIEIRKGGARV